MALPVRRGLLEVTCATTLYRYTGRALPASGRPSSFFAVGIRSFYFLNRSLVKVPIGTAYAVWTGIGAAGTAIIGIAFYNEDGGPLRWRLLAILIAAIVWVEAGFTAMMPGPTPRLLNREGPHDQLLPREIVSELDRYIVGQDDAKRAVAIALRNRWRRQQLTGELREEVLPKNILMIGPTGVGKTEISRRLAKLAGAPFLKVEATKFTEVGYVGRDVDQIVRDLVEVGIALVTRDASARRSGRGREECRGARARRPGRRQRLSRDPREASASGCAAAS